MILVSNKLVNVFSSEEMNDSHKKKQKKSVDPVIPQISRGYNGLKNVNL